MSHAVAPFPDSSLRPLIAVKPILQLMQQTATACSCRVRLPLMGDQSFGAMRSTLQLMQVLPVQDQILH